MVGGGAGHHSCAHNKGDPTLVNRLRSMTRVHIGLLTDLVQKLSAANLLAQTLVLCGSDMSDGDAHNESNLPMVLCGAGADLKLGQEVGSATTPRPLSDLHVDILKLLGVPVTSLGEGRMASTGQPLPIRV